MRKISLTLILLLFVFYSCNSTDNIIKNTEVEYLQNKDITIIHDFIQPIQIQGRWKKTNYEEEFGNRKRDYFLYLKDDKNILGIYIKTNKTRSNFIDRKKFFDNSISKEIEYLEEIGITYELKTTDGENYQLYKFRSLNRDEFYGLIGLKNKKICYLSVYNNNLTEKEKELFLTNLFLNLNT